MTQPTQQDEARAMERLTDTLQTQEPTGVVEAFEQGFAEGMARGADQGLTLEGAIIIFAAFVVYMLPSFIAYFRKHHNVNAITVLNLFLGWTFLGWVAALVWSATAKRPRAVTE